MPSFQADDELLNLLLPGPSEAPRRQKLARFLADLEVAGECLRVPALAAEPAAEPADGAAQDEALLEALEQNELAQALERLACAYLGARLPRGSHFSFCRSALSVAGDWVVLARARTGPKPHPPTPGESDLAVSERLLAALAQVEGPRFAARLWHLRCKLAAEGPTALAHSLEEPAPKRGGLLERRALLALEAELYLERGAPQRVERLLEAHPLELALDNHLLRSLVLARLALERAAPSPELLASVSAREQAWPEPVLEWCQAMPRLARLWPQLANAVGSAQDQRGPEDWPAPAPLSGPGADPRRWRQELGASVLLVFELVAGGDPRPMAGDVAPALQERLPRFLDGLAGALRDPRRAEARLLQGAEPVRWHAEPGAQLIGCLGPARALWLWPLLDRSGELHGWLHLEWEHHLLPHSARLRTAAAGVLFEPAPAPASSAAPRRMGLQLRAAEAPEFASATPPEGVDVWTELESDDPRCRLATALAGELGFKWGRRRWWLLELEGARWTLVAHGGEGLTDWRRQRAPARALKRAARCGLALAYDGLPATGEPQGLTQRSAAGLVLPISSGAVASYFVLESERRADFAAGDVERAGRLAAAMAERYERARFRAWWRNEGEGDLETYLLWPGPLDELKRLARARRLPLVSGPCGSGRSSLLAWMAFLRAPAGFPAVPRQRFLPSLTPSDWEHMAAPGEPWILSQLGSAPAEQQERLAAVLKERQAALAESSSPARDLLIEIESEERLYAPLDQQLGSAALLLSDLSAGRSCLPNVIALLLQRAARQEQRPEPILSDGALGQLWRQEWPRGLRHLFALLQRLVLLPSGPPIEAPEVVDALRRMGLEPVKKLPSRHPSSALLRQVLCATALSNGRSNKSRAALFLGWDVDTLDARLAERGLSAGPSVGGSGAADSASGLEH